MQRFRLVLGQCGYRRGVERGKRRQAIVEKEVEEGNLEEKRRG